MAVTWASALGWRLERQFLDPLGSTSVVDVVERMGALPAWPDAAAELGVGLRRSSGRSGDVAAAVADGSIVKAYTFRGATHLMTPADAGNYLAVRESSRQWELTSWQQHYDLPADAWPAFRAHVRDALADGPLTRSELAAALGRSRRYRHLRDTVADGNDTLIKPLHWQGDICFGAPRDGVATLQRSDSVPGWAGVPDVEDAAPRVIDAYLRVHGPARLEQIHRWVGESLGGRRKAVSRWLSDLADRVASLRVGGVDVVVLESDLASLQAATASSSVRLLPGRDPWVMGPGTADPAVVPPSHREPVSRTSNLVLHRGVVAGTWALRGETLTVTWFDDSGRVPRAALTAEADRLGAQLDRSLETVVSPG